MRTTAAVLEEIGGPLQVTELDLAPPRRDEVRVRLHASGICHSDLSLIKGAWPVPLPMVLGHEGAGTIDGVGPGVAESRIGEQVVLTFTPPCGRCRFCLAGRVNLCTAAAAAFETGLLHDGTTRLSPRGRPVYHLALVSSFAQHTVVPATAAVAVPPGLDPAFTCLLGCGVMTGVMAVTRLAGVRPGDSVAVFGCGGVGLSAVQGARLVSAHPIIAVDPLAAKRALALRFGATHALDPLAGDVVRALRTLLPAGADYTVEAVGDPRVEAQAVAATATGGTTVLIGQPAAGVTAAFPIYDLTQFEHTILGTHIGGANPPLDIPRLAALLAAGKLDLAALVTHRFGLDAINDAIAVVASGEAGRVIVDLR
ncbi:MAG: Zn-dependent alcohol dehydrogenase [Chloroflexota bacterium]